MPHNPPPETIAAVDLGSNSFHMIVARVTDGNIQIIDRLREMVRLGAGLDGDKRIIPAARTRALACIGRFGQRVGELPQGSVRAVGTNTLRQTREAELFLELAQEALGHRIEVIAGHEEARLVYLGVAHGLAAGDEQRLVVDIGGGSTELIIGQGFEPMRRESLYMGCVSMSRNHFPEGRITPEAMEAAELASALELRPVRMEYRGIGWDRAMGSSGTIRTIGEVVQAAGWSSNGITLESLKRLRRALLEAGSVERLDLEGLSAERRTVFPGGVAVLLAMFNALRIESMEVSDQALREGLLYDMLGRIRHEDVRARTVQALCNRYSLDAGHAGRVEVTARDLFRQVADEWRLEDDGELELLCWAARLHEVGLTVAHSQFHKHGAYLVENADLSGFSRQEQSQLAALIRGHRRKFSKDVFSALPYAVRESSMRLCLLLRLAILLHRSRTLYPSHAARLKVRENHLQLTFTEDWLAQHPLTRMELEQEQRRLQNAGIWLSFD